MRVSFDRGYGPDGWRESEESESVKERKTTDGEWMGYVCVWGGGGGGGW